MFQLDRVADPAAVIAVRNAFPRACMEKLACAGLPSQWEDIPGTFSVSIDATHDYRVQVPRRVGKAPSSYEYLWLICGIEWQDL